MEATDKELRDMTCPECGKAFRLLWDEENFRSTGPVTLQIRSCPSGGIYDVRISCPHCEYEEQL